ncbi:MAG: heavy-metal-associated domain-containing protein [Oscillospiraceae bacterium]|nr:heavy-metal-associated domain-containing protein [Oscillospiraceae bacterium]
MIKTLKIEGMSCGHCTARVAAALKELDGVENVEMSLENKTAVVTLSKDVSDAVLSETVDNTGFDVVGIE